MKLLFVANTSYYLYNFRRNLIKAVLDCGNEVVVAAPPDKFTHKLESLGVCFIPLQQMNRKGMNPFKDLLLFHELHSLFKKEKPDLALTFTVKANIYGSLVCGMHGIGSISTVTGLGHAFSKPSGALRTIVSGLYSVAYRFPRRVVFQNPDDVEAFVSAKIVDEARCIMTPGSGVDLDYFTPAPVTRRPDQPVFLMCSRMLKSKGVFEFAEAAGLVARHYPDARFHLMGPLDDGNPLAISRAEMTSLEERSCVRYLGEREDVRPYLSDCFAVVLPSKYPEGIPKILLEAAAVGKPIITTNVPGCREVVADGKNGFLVEAGDSAALASRMLSLLGLAEDELKSMRDHSLCKAIFQFNEQIVIGKYLDAIAKVSA